MYIDEFKIALKRTVSLGLNCPDVKFSSESFLIGSVLDSLPFVLRDILGLVTIKQLSAQCLSIHNQLQVPMSEIFNTPSYFTIGFVETADGQLFYQSENDLKNIIKNGINGSTLNVHAWITLSSMEILDFTLPTTEAVVKKREEGLRGMITSHPDSLKSGMKYHPMLIGNDFLKKSGILIEL